MVSLGFMVTFKIYTLGCKVNQYDSQSIRESLLARGFEENYNGRQADIYVVNTCTVTANADRDSRYYINLARRQNPKARIIVTGCYAQLDGKEIAVIPGVTDVLKNEEKYNISNLIGEVSYSPRQNQNNACFSRGWKEKTAGISGFSGRTRAFLKIQDGCDNFCSYCKVPLVRGRSVSKPLKEIAVEASGLAGNGFKEIVLTGICLGAYRDKTGEELVDVLHALENIEGLLRIRLSSIEAGDVSDGLIEKMAGSKILCRHLHIPIQSGDNEILARMNRHYSREDYLALIKKIKRRIPDIAFTTDVIAGFPQESETNFQNTLKLVEQIKPLKVHIFPYSRREAAAASKFDGEITAAVIRQRIRRLENIAESCAFEYKKRFLHKKLNVLIEGRSKKYKNYWEGLTDNYIKVLIKSDKDLKNKLIAVRIDSIGGELRTEALAISC